MLMHKSSCVKKKKFMCNIFPLSTAENKCFFHGVLVKEEDLKYICAF